MKIGDVELKWLGHAGFLIAPLGVSPKEGKNSKIIYIDPYKIKSDLPKADIILLTHGHYDHCSVEDLEKIIKPGTRIICPPDVQSKVTRFEVPIKLEVIGLNQEIKLGNIKVSSFPAYNLDKTFHTKEEGLIGFIIKMNDVIVYHAGDTDFIPEMEKLTGYSKQGKTFVALLPIGGRFTMSVEEAQEASKLIKPTIVVPMHWGSIIGSKEDALEFKSLCEDDGLRVEILNKE